MKTNKMRLYLDDVRTPNAEDWIVVRNYDEFVSIIRLNGLDKFDVISLDHDLGDTAMIEYYNNVKENYIINYDNIIEKTGYDCCKFLVSESINKNIPLPQIYIHSANPIGSANMMGYINNYLKNCKLDQSCIQVTISHTIDEKFILSPEARLAKWKRG
jgi:hypothetical protein